MEKLLLVIPDESHLEQIAAYRRAMLDAGSSMDGCGGLIKMENPRDWLRVNELMTREETTPPPYVPQTQFVCVRASDRKIVGMINVRHRFNEHLRLYGGHIGYSVHPDERRKGVATWMLRQALKHCDELGIRPVLLTCDETNEGSRRTMLRCGGVYESTVTTPDGERHQRYWFHV